MYDLAASNGQKAHVEVNAGVLMKSCRYVVVQCDRLLTALTALFVNLKVYLAS